MEYEPIPPEGYKLLDGYFDYELPVKKTDLVWDLKDKIWNHPKTCWYKSLGIVENYWFVCRQLKN